MARKSELGGFECKRDRSEGGYTYNTDDYIPGADPSPFTGIILEIQLGFYNNSYWGFLAFRALVVGSNFIDVRY